MSKSRAVMREPLSKSRGLPIAESGVLPRSGQGTGLRALRERKCAAAAEGRISRFAWMCPGARPDVGVLWAPERQLRRTSWAGLRGCWVMFGFGDMEGVLLKLWTYCINLS